MPKRIAKVRPLSLELLRPVRQREHHACPYCGGEFSLTDAIKTKSMGYYIVDCPSCTVGFFLPLSRSFKPAEPRPIQLGAGGWAECPECKALFVFKHRYEQCPCCGKILFEKGSRFEFKLEDNSSEVLAATKNFQKQHKPWWRVI